MDQTQILEMIASNRKFLKLKSSIALQNLAMLHRSFDGVDDEECILSLALNDSVAAMLFDADYAKAIAISQGMIDRFPHSPHTFLLACHATRIGRCLTYALRHEEAHSVLSRALDQIALLPDDEEVIGQRADILHDLAMNNYYAEKDAAETIAYLEKALAVMGDKGYENRRGICLMGMGNVLDDQGRYGEALNHHLKAMELFDEADNYGNLATVLCNIGTAYIGLGLPADAEPYLLRSLDMRSRMGNYGDIATSYYNLALLYKAKGETEKAYSTMMTGCDYALVSQKKGLQILILEQLAELAEYLEDPAAAEQHRTRRDGIDSK